MQFVILKFLDFLFCGLLLFPFVSKAASVDAAFEKSKTSSQSLYQFLKAMPKGGELHYHFSGSLEPELMLKLASTGKYCINTSSYKITKDDKLCDGFSVSKLQPQVALYEQILSAWSMKNFHSSKESGHDHFFATFEKFYQIVLDFPVPLLASVMQKAADQHELYMEIMLDPLMSKSFDNLVTKRNLNFSELRQELLKQPLFLSELSKYIATKNKLIPAAKHYLSCQQKPNQPVCLMEIRFQYLVLREQPWKLVFEHALFGFELASKSKSFLSVNLVQPEDGNLALRDYEKQMEIFAFMHKLYPEVKISLHAGELAQGFVSPSNLKFHIHDAIYKGMALRIGHGVDIQEENFSQELAAYMAKHGIAVEINLSSNKAILNVSGKKHPLNFYLRHEVPVVLSTDDEGILQTDLTQQYLLAVVEHHLSYRKLKQLSRASLNFSFLPGKSFWANFSKESPVLACTNLNSKSCLDFVSKNEKARLQRLLELDFLKFEGDISLNSA